MTPLVTIIIPTFNRNELLKLGMASLAKQQVTFSYEIIILNEYVDDESREIAQQYNARYILTRPKMTLNNVVWRCPGLAINHGVKQSKGQYIVLTCPEIFHIHSNNLESIIQPLQTNHRLITHTNGYDDLNGFALEAVKTNPNDTVRVFNLCCMNELYTKNAFFIAMNKNEFYYIGGYDEDFQAGFAYDDTNFSNRLTNNGNPYLKVPGSFVHLYHPRIRLNLDNKDELWNKNRLLHQTKFHERFANHGREWGVLDA